jgi:hypothetical protein
MARLVSSFIICIVLCVLCVLSGCTSSKAPESPVVTTVVTTAPVSTATLPPTAAATATEVAPVKTTSVPVSVVTTMGKSSVKEGADDHQILNLIHRKNYFNNPIPNCIMKEAFPIAAKDSTYGIKQSPPKIVAISPKEMNVFMREYMEGANEAAKTVGVSRCNAVPVNPYWNFVKIDATIMPRNANPADYEIGINVRSAGKIIAQVPITETLTINQPLMLESYIPLKSDEMDFFDSIELVFHKKT